MRELSGLYKLRNLYIWATAAVATSAFSASAETVHILNGTVVALQATEQPDAVAEVEFDNRAVNSNSDDSTFPLDLSYVGVSITFRWNANPAGDDEITIETDADHVAVPPRLVVAEGESGTAYVYPLESVGF